MPVLILNSQMSRWEDCANFCFYSRSSCHAWSYVDESRCNDDQTICEQYWLLFLYKTVKDTQASDEADNPFSKSLMEDSKHFTGNALYTIAQKEHAQHPTHPGII